MAFIAYCYRWPCGAPPLVLPVLRYIIITCTYIPTHYLHRNIQQHIRMYANNNTVCCIHLTNYLHFLSQSSHTEGQRHPLGPRCLDNTHRWWCSRSSLSVWPRWFVLVNSAGTICYNIWRNTMCDKYVSNMCVSGTLLCLCLYLYLCRSSQV